MNPKHHSYLKPTGLLSILNIEFYFFRQTSNEN